ncbi:MAG: dicarboxylate/amino acid:cation symporter [Saprospiraceae bacterium]|nr:dicarboxylate/amino acid:cation symporter [Saprospiraceae bacterium]
MITLSDSKRNRIINSGSLVAIILGVGCGLWVRHLGIDQAGDFLAINKLIGVLWIDAVLLLVLPLIVCYIGYSLLGFGEHRLLGVFGAQALRMHLFLMVLMLLLSLIVGFVLLQLWRDSVSLPSLDGSFPEDVLPDGKERFVLVNRAETLQAWLGKLVLWLLVTACAGALVVRKFLPQWVPRFRPFLKRGADKSMGRMQNLLLTMPLAVFALTVPMVAGSGMSAIGVAGLYVVTASTILFLFTLLMYLPIFLLTDLSIRKFATSLISAQLMAISTRSSLASIPAIIQVCTSRLGIPTATSAVVVPFCISFFRPHRIIVSPYKYLFLFAMFDLGVSIPLFATFLLLQFLTSFLSPGIPGGAGLNLPVYEITGVPMQGYFLLRAVDAIPDIFMTLANVTEVLVIMTLTASKFNLIDENLLKA